jgi:hypothetical protein
VAPCTRSRGAPWAAAAWRWALRCVLRDLGPWLRASAWYRVITAMRKHLRLVTLYKRRHHRNHASSASAVGVGGEISTIAPVITQKPSQQAVITTPQALSQPPPLTTPVARPVASGDAPMASPAATSVSFGEVANAAVAAANAAAIAAAAAASAAAKAGGEAAAAAGAAAGVAAAGVTSSGNGGGGGGGGNGSTSSVVVPLLLHGAAGSGEAAVEEWEIAALEVEATVAAIRLARAAARLELTVEARRLEIGCATSRLDMRESWLLFTDLVCWGGGGGGQSTNGQELGDANRGGVNIGSNGIGSDEDYCVLAQWPSRALLPPSTAPETSQAVVAAEVPVVSRASKWLSFTFRSGRDASQHQHKHSSIAAT